MFTENPCSKLNDCNVSNETANKQTLKIIYKDGVSESHW